MSEKTYTSNIPAVTPIETLPKQFVLDRTDMSTSFSDSEYQACLNAITAGQVVAVNWIQGDVTRQLQLASVSATGVLKFSYVRGYDLDTWTVTASSPHSITHESYDVDPTDFAPAEYGTNEVHNLPTSITAFRSDDVIPVDGPDGTAKMGKDDLLQTIKGDVKLYSITIEGKGNTYVDNGEVYGLVAGRKYKVTCKGLDFNSDSSEGALMLSISTFKNGVATRYVQKRQAATFDPSYYNEITFTAVDNDLFQIGGRFTNGSINTFVVEDVTDAFYAGTNNLTFEGNDLSYSYNDYWYNFQVGKTYIVRFWNENVSLPVYTDTTLYRFIISLHKADGTQIRRAVTVRITEDLQKEYSFTIDENTAFVRFGGRATKGTRVVASCDELPAPKFSIGNMIPIVLPRQSLENQGVSAGYPNHNGSTTRVTSNDIIQFPQKAGKLKVHLPKGMWCYFISYYANGNFDKYLGYDVALRDGDELVYNTEPDGNYGYRICFGKNGNLDITANEVATYISNGDIVIAVDDFCVQQESNVQISSAVSASRNLIASAPWSEKRPTFVHVSDVHSDAKRVKNAMKVAEFIEADALVVSGDSVLYNGANGCGFLKDISDDGGVPLLNCIGNHESRPTGSATLFADFIQPLVAKNGYLKSSGVDADNCYWYKDFDSKKIRFIAVNYYNNGVYNGSLGQAQLEWLCSTLDSTPAGYGVIIEIHSPEDRIDDVENCTKFKQTIRVVEYQENGFYVGNRPIMQIVDAFISRSSVSISYTDAGSPVSITHDFSAVDNGCEFIAYMCGHRHEDWIGKYHNSTYYQLSLGITCGNAFDSMHVNTAFANNGDLGRNEGKGIPQDAMNVYAIDRDNGLVYVVRIGADTTIDLKKRDMMAIPYRT